MKTHYGILIGGRPFISLSSLKAVAVVCADIRINSPEAQIQVFRNDVTEVTSEILSKSYDIGLEGPGDPDRVE